MSSPELELELELAPVAELELEPPAIDAEHRVDAHETETVRQILATMTRHLQEAHRGADPMEQLRRAVGAVGGIAYDRGATPLAQRR